MGKRESKCFTFFLHIRKHMDSPTSHHLSISSVCYSINMRIVHYFLPVSCDKIFSVYLYILEGINCNQNWTCFTLQKGNIKTVKGEWKRRYDSDSQAWARGPYHTYIDFILRISALEIVKYWWLVQITKLYKIIYTIQYIWVCR